MGNEESWSNTVRVWWRPKDTQLHQRSLQVFLTFTAATFRPLKGCLSSNCHPIHPRLPSVLSVLHVVEVYDVTVLSQWSLVPCCPYNTVLCCMQPQRGVERAIHGVDRRGCHRPVSWLALPSWRMHNVIIKGNTPHPHTCISRTLRSSGNTKSNCRQAMANSGTAPVSQKAINSTMHVEDKAKVPTLL